MENSLSEGAAFSCVQLWKFWSGTSCSGVVFVITAIVYWLELLSIGKTPPPAKKKSLDPPTLVVPAKKCEKFSIFVTKHTRHLVGRAFRRLANNMATSLAAQLAQIATKSKNSLNIKTQRAAHSKSLIFEPRVATGQSFLTIYTLCYEGFEDLCRLDSRFAQFNTTLFSEQSQEEDRTQLTAGENEQLDKRIEAFLRLAGSRLRLMPAIKAVEWLIRRFRYVSKVWP